MPGLLRHNFSFSVTVFCNGLRAERLPCLHHIVVRPTGIRQVVQEIFCFRALELGSSPTCGARLDEGRWS